MTSRVSGTRISALALVLVSVSSLFALPAAAAKYDGGWSMVVVTNRGHCGTIDVGMGVTNAGSGLTGMLRVSTSTPSSRADIPTGGTALDEYGQNIQIGDLNALNAALAVVQWKRHLGFYADMTSPTSTFVYPISDNVITGVTE